MWEVESTGGIRAPLYSGGFTVDDLFALSPYVIPVFTLLIHLMPG